MVVGGHGFDFDALDELERALPRAGSDQQLPACPAQLQDREGPSEQAGDSSSSDVAVVSNQAWTAAPMSSDQLAACPSQGSKLAARKEKPMSRARAWFEIRKLMEAVPQEYYKSENKDEWKTYWAKELILKKVLEKIKTEGYAVVDAQLSPDFHEELSSNLGHLALEAPEALQAIVDDSSFNEGRTLCAAGTSDDPSSNVGGVAYGSEIVNVSTSCSGLIPRYSTHAEGYNGCQVVLGARSAPQSTALVDANATALQPRDKETFLKVFKTFLHVVANNSVSKTEVSQEHKIPVQLVFGTPPPGKYALPAPKQAGQIQDAPLVD